MRAPDASALTCAMQPGCTPRWEALCAVASAGLLNLRTHGQAAGRRHCLGLLSGGHRLGPFRRRQSRLPCPTLCPLAMPWY